MWCLLGDGIPCRRRSSGRHLSLFPDGGRGKPLFKDLQSAVGRLEGGFPLHICDIWLYDDGYETLFKRAMRGSLSALYSTISATIRTHMESSIMANVNGFTMMDMVPITKIMDNGEDNRTAQTRISPGTAGQRAVRKKKFSVCGFVS